MHARPTKSLIEVTDDAQFLSEVFSANEPVLAAFLAPWSRPCQILTPVLEDIAASPRRHLKVLTVNVDEHVDLSAWYEIWDIPTLLCFVNGWVCVTLIGVTDKKTILSTLHASLSSSNPKVQTPLKPTDER